MNQATEDKLLDIICPIKDFDSKKSLLQNGYVVFNKIALPFLNDLHTLSSNYIVDKEQTFQYSLMEHSYEENLHLHQQLNEQLRPLLNSIFEQYSTYSGSLLIKPGVSGTEMNLHQDWTLTDEKKFTPCTVWIPLQNTSEQNGSLFFLPGSHRIFTNFRSHHYETARISKELFSKSVKSINVEKGDIVVFNPACFHGSFPNENSDSRVAISITVLDKNAPFLHVKKETEGSARIFHLSADCFLKDLAQLNEKYAFESNYFESIAYSHHVPTVEEIKLKLATHVY
jgi:ectoine hydroxylase-related dioxygenase (phytanoyl-CoA dioxygenase family)